MRERNTILISGYAKLPANVTAETVYNVMAVVVCVDKRNGTIQSAEASVVTQLAKDFISELFVGYNMNDGPYELIAAFDEYYHGSAKKAIETATRMVFVKYQDYIANHPTKK